MTYVALPKVGDKVSANQRFGEIESVKATSDLYSGVSGTVSAINNDLTSNPGMVNSDPFNAGWMIKVKATNPGELNSLLSPDDYVKKAGH